MTGDGHQVMIEQHSDRYATVCACGWRGEEWDDLRRAEADAWRHEHDDNDWSSCDHRARGRRQRRLVSRSPRPLRWRA